MENRVISYSSQMKKNNLDDDYTLYENGEILHEYDAHAYPGGQNKTRKITANDLSESVKKRLLESASEDNKYLVKKILGLNEAE